MTFKERFNKQVNSITGRNKEVIQPVKEVKEESITMGAHPSTPLKNTTLPYVSSRMGTPYVYFGIDNFYPQFLVDLYNMSPIHQAICNRKSQMVSGIGIDYELSEGIDELQVAQLSGLTEYASFDDESLHEVLQYAALDWIYAGALALEVVWDKLHRRIVKINHVKVENIRIGVPCEDGSIDTYWYCRDWVTYRYGTPYGVPAFNPEDKESFTQIFYVRNKSVGVEFYGMPSYNSATNWIQANSNVGVFNNQITRNGFLAGHTIMIPREPSSQEERHAIVRNLTKSYSSVDNAARLMVMFGKSKDDLPQITPIDQNNLDTRFTAVNDQNVSEILTSHGVTVPELFGITTPGKLGSSNSIEEGWKLFDVAEITPTREKLARIFTRLLNQGGYKDVKLKLIPYTPFGVQAQASDVIEDKSKNENNEI